MNKLNHIWQDIQKGKNLEFYILITFLIVIALLRLLGISNERLITPVLLAALALLLSSALRIRDTLESLSDNNPSQSKPNEFQANQAFDHFNVELESQCKNRNNKSGLLSVKVLGLRGRYIANWMDRLLKQNADKAWLRDIDFEFFIGDPDLATTIDGLKKYESAMAASRESLEALAQETANKPLWLSKGVSIHVYTFSTLNPFQAFLIGDKLNLTHFIPIIENGRVEDWTGLAKNPYFSYSRNNKQDRFMFDMVESWANYYRIQQQKKLGPSTST